MIMDPDRWRAPKSARASWQIYVLTAWASSAAPVGSEASDDSALALAIAGCCSPSAAPTRPAVNHRGANFDDRTLPRLLA